MDDTGGVRVTNREIYDAVLELQRTVEHLSGQVVRGSATEADHESRLRVLEVNQANPKHVEDVERRLRFLERAAWALPPTLIVSVIALVLRASAA